MNCGFSRQQIVFDPGVGFSKTPYQNFGLINNIEQLQKLSVALCVSHSRKSSIQLFNHCEVQERDIGTIAIFNYLAKNNVDYLSFHNDADRQRSLVASAIV